MGNYINLMNSTWYGDIPNYDGAQILKYILDAKTEKDLVLQLTELFKLGDFTQKPLLIELLNQTRDDAVLNLCIRLFCSVSTHQDLKDPNSLAFLEKATGEAVNTFASAATTTLSLEVVPHLLALLEDWDDISDTSVIIRDSIDAFIDFEEYLGEEATVEEIGEYYLDYMEDCDPEKYYYHGDLAFPGDLAKKLIERVLIAANNHQSLEMEVIPSLLSIWTGEKVPGDYYTLINSDNYKSYINYVGGISKKNWDKGQKYFYGHLLID